MIAFLRCAFCRLLALFRIVGVVSFYVYPPTICSLLNIVLDAFYSGRISKRFGYCGKNLIVNRKIHLFHPHLIKIGNNVSIHKNAILATHSDNAQFIIENDVVIGEYCHVTCTSMIIIGNGVLMGKKCIITDNSHGIIDYNSLLVPPNKRPVVSKGDVTIGRNVWIGDNVVVLPGVTIGECSIIGASSVVTKSIPPFSVCVGNPAHVIKTMI